MEPKRHLQISYLRFRINILPLSKNSENIILHCDHPLTQHNAAARNESSLQNTLYFFPLAPSAKWLFVHERHRASETDQFLKHPGLLRQQKHDPGNFPGGDVYGALISQSTQYGLYQQWVHLNIPVLCLILRVSVSRHKSNVGLEVT